MSCELILALDVPTRAEAAPLLKELRGTVRWVKIGLQMFTAYGPDYVREVAAEGFNIFLDLKLHDIPNTVAKAVESVSALPIGMLTLHTSGGSQMMRVALESQRKKSPNLLILGVTVLTSMDGAGLRELGIEAEPDAQVMRLASLAAGAGMGGLVCSPLELTTLRARLSSAVKLVTPGIRSASDKGSDDQKRTMTPTEAAAAGADYIVVGRPILKAASPARAAAEILAQIGST